MKPREYLVAIDPGSNTTGLAFFKDGILEATTSLYAKQSLALQVKRVQLSSQVFSDVMDFLEDISVNDDYRIVSEEPFLQGRSNTSMQRYLGCLEASFEGRLEYVHPMTVKKNIGHGTLDKIEVAINIGNLVKTEAEQEIIAEALSREAFDETDAIAVGLTFLMKEKDVV